MQQCNALTKRFKRCRQPAEPGSTMCVNHEKNHAPVYTRDSLPTVQWGTKKPIDTSVYPGLIKTRTVERKDYHAYLDSKEWQQKAQAKKKENPNCSLCNREIRIMHTHHRTYVRCGNENKHDLTVLCSDCHDLFHENYSYDDRSGCFIPKEK